MSFADVVVEENVGVEDKEDVTSGEVSFIIMSCTCSKSSECCTLKWLEEDDFSGSGIDGVGVVCNGVLKSFPNWLLKDFNFSVCLLRRDKDC